MRSQTGSLGQIASMAGIERRMTMMPGMAGGEFKLNMSQMGMPQPAMTMGGDGMMITPTKSQIPNQGLQRSQSTIGGPVSFIFPPGQMGMAGLSGTPQIPTFRSDPLGS